MNGIVFDIQYNALYDGPGIRTLVFLKGCPLRCGWCHNPESQLLKPQVSYFADKCTACGECVEACPENALELRKKRVVRDAGKCVVCGSCAEACPGGATEMIGKEMTAAEVAEKVMRDKVFYENSGGGATISGGEPTFQADFLLETLNEIKKHGIRTAIETCGYFDEKLIGDLVASADLFLFDIKQVDPGLHKEHTGVPPGAILSNFREILSRAGAERIVPRVPLIPSFNTDAESIEKIIAFLKDAGYTGPVHLMPYNRLAKTKWEKIGRGDEYADMGGLADEDIDDITAKFENTGFKVVCNR